MRNAISTVVVAYAMFGAMAAASEIDLSAHVNELLSKKPTVDYERTETFTEKSCSWVPDKIGTCNDGGEIKSSPTKVTDEITPQCSRIECVDKEKTRKIRYSGFARVKNLTPTVMGGVELHEPKARNVGTSAVVLETSGINCISKGAQGTVSQFRDTLNYSRSDSWSLTFGKTITSRSSLSANMKFQPSKAFGFGVSKTYSDSVSLSENSHKGNSEARTYSRTWSQGLNPGEKLVGRMVVVERKYEIPFEVTVLVKGLLVDNLSGNKRVEDLLSKEERTFKVKGVLVADLGSASAEQKSITSLVTKEDCKDRDGLTAITLPMRRVPYSEVINEKLNSETKSLYELGLGTPYSAHSSPHPLSGNNLDWGSPGGWCYTAPCNYPDDGYRQVCYYDEEGFCQDCSDEYDAVCDPVEESPGLSQPAFFR